MTRRGFRGSELASSSCSPARHVMRKVGRVGMVGTLLVGMLAASSNAAQAAELPPVPSWLANSLGDLVDDPAWLATMTDVSTDILAAGGSGAAAVPAAGACAVACPVGALVLGGSAAIYATWHYSQGLNAPNSDVAPSDAVGGAAGWAPTQLGNSNMAAGTFLRDGYHDCKYTATVSHVVANASQVVAHLRITLEDGPSSHGDCSITVTQGSMSGSWRADTVQSDVKGYGEPEVFGDFCSPVCELDFDVPVSDITAYENGFSDLWAQIPGLSPSAWPHWQDPNYVQNQTPNITNGASANPIRSLVSSSRCVRAGSPDIVTTHQGATFTELDANKPTMMIPSCPAGYARTSAQVIEHTVDGSAPDKTLLHPTFPATLPSTLPPTYTECLPGGDDFPCLLVLNRVLANGTVRQYDPAVDPNPATDPTVNRDYTCKWGPLTVPTTECKFIWSQTSTTGTSDDNPGGAVTGVNVTGCISAGVSFNPISWVLEPVKCALKWAFEPVGVASLWTAFQSDLSGRAPWSYILVGPQFVGGVVGGFTHPDSCTGDQTGNPTGPLAGLKLDDIQPWCALSTNAGSGGFTVGKMRSIATAGIWCVFLWACYHRAKRLIGEGGPADPGGAGGDAAGYSPEQDIDAYNGLGGFT